MLIGWGLTLLVPRSSARARKLVILGAGVPDIPLILVVATCAIFRWSATGSICGLRPLVDRFYFEDHAFIAFHHLLHSPTNYVFILFAWWTCRAFFGARVDIVLNFVAGAFSHALVDLCTHAEDGALFLWPLDWNVRLNAGVNQWDLASTGILVAAMEAAIWLVAAAVLAVRSREARFPSD